MKLQFTEVKQDAVLLLSRFCERKFSPSFAIQSVEGFNFYPEYTCNEEPL